MAATWINPLRNRDCTSWIGDSARSLYHQRPSAAGNTRSSRAFVDSCVSVSAAQMASKTEASMSMCTTRRPKNMTVPCPVVARLMVASIRSSPSLSERRHEDVASTSS